ncbi:Ig-like domain-containing protein [Persicirhabdus sediminis]|nr:Ig-like domain-containing protein [Persicirhabdus sediminis]
MKHMMMRGSIAYRQVASLAAAMALASSHALATEVASTIDTGTSLNQYLVGETPQDGVNLLVNEGFELPVGATAISASGDWSEQGNRQLIQSSAWARHSGDQGVWLQAWQANTASSFYQDVAIVGGGEYNLGGWFKFEQNFKRNGSAVEMAMIWLDDAGVEISRASQNIELSSVYSWELVDFAQVAPENAVTARVMVSWTTGSEIISGSACSCMIDDMTFSYVHRNSPPIAEDVTGIVTIENQPISIDVMANDSDPDGDELTIIEVAAANLGATSTDGQLVSYVPNTGAVGDDSFSYTISDGNGGTASATVSLTIEAANKPPEFGEDLYVMAGGTENALYSESIASFATDPDGDPLTFSKLSGPSWLSLAGDGSLSGTPSSFDLGLHRMEVQVSDGKLTDTTMLEISISAVTGSLPYLSWNHQFGTRVSAVAAAPYAGLYAHAERVSNSVVINDIDGNELARIDAAAMKQAAPWLDFSGDDYGPAGMAFTASGRQLFITLIGSPSSSNGGEPKDAILAYNHNLNELRLFAQVDLADELMYDIGVPVCHVGGELFVGTQDNQVLRYLAQMNDVEGTFVESINVAGANGVTGLTADIANDQLYVSTQTVLSRLDLTNDSELVAQTLMSCPTTKAITFARVFGAEGDEGLYLLQMNGDIQVVPMADLQAGGEITNQQVYESTGTSLSIDISATACGRLMLASTAPYIISAAADERMDFDSWLADEFNQYINLAKTLCWPDGEPEGWVIDAQVRDGRNRFHPPSTDTASWAVLMLMLADELNGDDDAEQLVEKILVRWAGLAADGIVAETTPDGEFHHWYDKDTGAPTWSGDDPFTNPFSTQKIVVAALRAGEYYSSNERIVAAVQSIIGRQKNKREYVFSRGMCGPLADDLGPRNNGGWGPGVENHGYAELMAALDPMTAHSFEYYWRDRENNQYDHYLADEPILHSGHAAFIGMYPRQLMTVWRNDPLWKQDFSNTLASFNAWTDDNAPAYLTVFSAGVNTSGYNADDLNRHPDTVSHFPALLGFSMLDQNTIPAVAAYMAYRDGRRQLLSGSDAFPNGANIVTRYSNEVPSFVMGDIALPDSAFAMFGLAELLEPGVVDRVFARETYKDLSVGTGVSGEVELDYSELISRRVLGSDDGWETWTSYGFQYAPFSFEYGRSHAEYTLAEPEGRFIPIPNHNAEGVWNHWTRYGGYASYCGNGEFLNLVGRSFMMNLAPGETVTEGGAYQTIELSDEWDETAFIIGALGRVQDAANGEAFIAIEWDNDADPTNGIIGERIESENRVSVLNPRDEFEISTLRPAGATHLHIYMVLQLTGETPVKTERYAWDEFSLVRVGAEAVMENQGFEQGSLAHWGTYSPNGSSWAITDEEDLVCEGNFAAKLTLPVTMTGKANIQPQYLDISQDPIGTRYVLRVDVATKNLEGSMANIYARMDDDEDEFPYTYIRQVNGDSLEIANTKQQLYLALRKRDVKETRLRIFCAGERLDSSAVTADEVIAFDNIHLTRETP